MPLHLPLQLPRVVGVYWATPTVSHLSAAPSVSGRRALTRRQLLMPGAAPAASPGPNAKKREQAKITQSKQPEESAPATALDGADTPAARVRPAHGKRRGKRKNRR